MNTSGHFPPPQRPRHRHLEHIHVPIVLKGGGCLDIYYRLTKNNHPNPEHAPCSYGLNPESNSIESYFSTQDTAALEIKLRNNSGHDLKHVRLCDVRVAPYCDDSDEGAKAAAAKDKLPDGNLFFEVVPNDIYYGHLGAGKELTKYLSLITRGVEPGNYVVRLDARYDIEQCREPLELGLAVNPD